MEVGNPVLSVFPGIGLLDRAFEEEGFCVVRGPDVLWGGDVRRFHPPPGVFGGVIGGPPCQVFSRLRHLLRASGRDTKAEDLIPEFCRVVSEARSAWFLMENVPEATMPEIAGYKTTRKSVVDWKAGGRTLRKRSFWFGVRGERAEPLAVDQSHWPAGNIPRAVTRNCRVPGEKHRKRAKSRGGVLPGDGPYMPIEEICELQGLPRDWTEPFPFRKEALRVMLGNGLPMAMGRALAKAVREILTAAEVAGISSE